MRINMKSSNVSKVIASKKNPRSFLFIIKDDIFTDDEGNTIDVLKLRHPKTGEGAYFVVNKIVHEIIKFSDDKRSYFIDDNVTSDGDLYFSTPVDPMFLILPYLTQAKHCSPLDQILVDEDFPEIGRLLNCDGIKLLHLVADRKGDEELQAYIYNEDKTLTWLQKKVDRIVTTLKTQGLHVSFSSAASANFVKSEKAQDTPESYLKYAVGLLGEYLQPQMLTKLIDFLGLQLEEKNTAIKEEHISPNDKRKGESLEKDRETKKPKLVEPNKTPTTNSKVEKVI
uniref:Ribonuclease H2 subunit B n=1 Tax=Rhodnius prolixus TaxID=13249 RepID=T1HQT3_RHOPR